MTIWIVVKVLEAFLLMKKARLARIEEILKAKPLDIPGQPKWPPNPEALRLETDFLRTEVKALELSIKEVKEGV